MNLFIIVTFFLVFSFFLFSVVHSLKFAEQNQKITFVINYLFIIIIFTTVRSLFFNKKKILMLRIENTNRLGPKNRKSKTELTIYSVVCFLENFSIQIKR